MPFIDVTIAQGRSPEAIRALIHELHEAAHRALDASPGSIRVVVREVPTTHWAAGDLTIAERHAHDQEVR
ncbi:4-oxalocrotonate tautomerase family protein [Amycolatopsis sp. cg5]|uniref:tautomerase family protein n=1 Tax=Amycolatopsis sp. cg5 TaxID=3238802 RepID=UPI0035259494